MKTTMDPEPIASTAPAIITFKSRAITEKPYACAVPGQHTEWFASEDARNLYAREMAIITRTKVRAGR